MYHRLKSTFYCMIVYRRVVVDEIEERDRELILQMDALCLGTLEHPTVRPKLATNNIFHD